MSLIEAVKNGSLAQLGERLPYKQDVTGSSPVTPTISFLFHKNAVVLHISVTQISFARII